MFQPLTSSNDQHESQQGVIDREDADSDLRRSPDNL